MPDASDVKCSSPTAVSGAESRSLLSVPSCPRSLPPQQNARPSSARRQLWRPPTDTRTRLETVAGAGGFPDGDCALTSGCCALLSADGAALYTGACPSAFAPPARWLDGASRVSPGFVDPEAGAVARVD